jgi:hypothetical protein
VFSCTAKKDEITVSDLALIPKPQKIEIQKGTFELNKTTTFNADEEFKIASDFFQDYIEKGIGFRVKNTSKNEATIVFEKDNNQATEG